MRITPCAELNGKNLSCYSNKIESVSLRIVRMISDLPTERTYALSRWRTFISFTYKMAAKINRHRIIWNKITSLSPYLYIQENVHCDIGYRMQRCDPLPLFRGGLCFCLSVGFNHELCQSGWTDRDAVWSVDSSGSKEPCTRWHPAEFPGERATECDFITRMLFKDVNWHFWH